MQFTWWFVDTFFWLLLLAAPLLLFLGLVIFLMGSLVNRIEGWNPKANRRNSNPERVTLSTEMRPGGLTGDLCR